MFVEKGGSARHSAGVAVVGVVGDGGEHFLDDLLLRNVGQVPAETHGVVKVSNHASNAVVLAAPSIAVICEYHIGSCTYRIL